MLRPSAKDTASQAVKDAYSGLKTLIQKRFADKGKSEGEMALTQYEKKTEVWAEPLKDSLVETGADSSPDIRIAVVVLKQALTAMPEGEKVLSKYNIKDCEVAIMPKLKAAFISAVKNSMPGMLSSHGGGQWKALL